MKCAVCYKCKIPDQNVYHHSVSDYLCNICSLKQTIKHCKNSIRNLKSKLLHAKIKLKLIGNK